MKEEKKSLELGRALFHFTTMMIALGVATWCPPSVTLALGFSFVIIIIRIDKARRQNTWFGNIVNTACKSMLRGEELKSRITSIDALIGFLLVYIVQLYMDSPPEVFTASVLVAAIADPMGRIMGRKFGKPGFPFPRKKTFIGTSSVFICAFVVIVFYLGAREAAIVAALVTLAELFSKKEWFMDDNFLVPISAAAGMWVFI